MSLPQPTQTDRVVRRRSNYESAQMQPGLAKAHQHRARWHDLYQGEDGRNMAEQDLRDGK